MPTLPVALLRTLEAGPDKLATAKYCVHSLTQLAPSLEAGALTAEHVEVPAERVLSDYPALSSDVATMKSMLLGVV